MIPGMWKNPALLSQRNCWIVTNTQKKLDATCLRKWTKKQANKQTYGIIKKEHAIAEYKPYNLLHSKAIKMYFKQQPL